MSLNAFKSNKDKKNPGPGPKSTQNKRSKTTDHTKPKAEAKKKYIKRALKGKKS